MKRILWAVLGRFAFYGSILSCGWWWMLWTPGDGRISSTKPLDSFEVQIQRQIRADILSLAGAIGERNVARKPEQLEQAAKFIETSFSAAGYRPESQWYRVGGIDCRNIEGEIRGGRDANQIVIIGAHYDSVPESPGADDNASGVATMLALAHRFAGTHPSRTVRFVGFANEEPPYFWHEEMGSLVYAKHCRQRGDQVVAMLSIESVGFYSDVPGSQHYPLGLDLIYPSTGSFVAFVGNLYSRALVHETLSAFRSSAALPSIGASVPNALPGAGWSDHWSFWQQGFPGIEVTDTAIYRNPYYHTPGDKPERLDYHRLMRFTWAMQTVVERLANPRSDT